MLYTNIVDATRPKNFKHLMVDIETMGNQSYSSILSIGATEFDPIAKTIGDSFYTVVDLESCLQAGLIINASTLYWWMKQNEEARKELFESEKQSIRDALIGFNTFLYDVKYDMWARSPRFDLGILQNAYEKLGMKIPWDFRKEKCVRTIEWLQSAKTIVVQGTVEHHALDDCRNQIQTVFNYYDHIQQGKLIPA